jgi:hypothetical protein
VELNTPRQCRVLAKRTRDIEQFQWHMAGHAKQPSLLRCLEHDAETWEAPPGRKPI